ncbi:macrophage mannose receptor 1-like isoform X1 [Homarus americanus]|uniref:Macrophage mannose receptor 1-like 5 n=1 Tax=Homarus americanus TaxID=6706 RepID=A0A8J5N5J8_HOMAM|nr:macrophage mannose receptor 1-like isoform X1 [Homarus americanus]KAG7173449.1 macrophage mannose receptor 1-like 5 [Homarus americanus]
MTSSLKTCSLVLLALLNTHVQAYTCGMGHRGVGQAAAATNLTSAVCEEPFVAVGDQCLYFATFASIPHLEAHQMCHSVGGELAAILTATRLYNIIHYIYNNGLDDRHFWIDGADQEQEGDWRSSSGAPIPRGTPFWEATVGGQQPDNYHEEDCLELPAGYCFYMNDVNCLYSLVPLCEQPSQLKQTTAVTTEVNCPTFFVNVGGLCLSFVTWASQNWADARQSCHGISGELATITDIEDLRAIYVYIHQEEIAGHSFWLGASDEASEGLWTWTDGQHVTMGSPFWGYTNEHYTLEPDGGSAENCLLLNAEGYHYFRDASCNLLANPLCLYH